MSINTKGLSKPHETDYERFLMSIESSLIYASLAYKKFLEKILANSSPHYLVAYEGEKIVGVLPTFLHHNALFGNVLNSLPFYGSNGGMIVSPDISNVQGVKQALVDAFYDLAKKESVAVSTIISNPLMMDNEFYEVHYKYTLREERIGQLTPLPVKDGNGEHVKEMLMDKFHKKTRNSIRKAEKGGFGVSHSDTMGALYQLADLHRQNIEGIGGLFKPRYVFEAIRDTFVYDNDYRIYVAEKDGKIVAALLVFFYNCTAEYFTPAVQEAYRSDQPVSLLAYEAMQEAVRRGCLYWNWGGTWLSQTGVYNFKKRWGTQDLPYFYYTTIFSEVILDQPKETLLREYPFFFVVPFSSLSRK